MRVGYIMDHNDYIMVRYLLQLRILERKFALSSVFYIFSTLYEFSRIYHFDIIFDIIIEFSFRKPNGKPFTQVVSCLAIMIRFQIWNSHS